MHQYSYSRLLLILIIALQLLAAICCSGNPGRGLSAEGSNVRESTPANGKTPSPEGRNASGNPQVNGKTLSPDMTDKEILEVFGIDPSKAEAKVSKGPDGYSTTYTQGKQMVSITHSAVTGLAVFASGPVEGTWSLGPKR